MGRRVLAGGCVSHSYIVSESPGLGVHVVFVASHLDVFGFSPLPYIHFLVFLASTSYSRGLAGVAILTYERTWVTRRVRMFGVAL